MRLFFKIFNFWAILCPFFFIFVWSKFFQNLFFLLFFFWLTQIFPKPNLPRACYLFFFLLSQQPHATITNNHRAGPSARPEHTRSCFILEKKNSASRNFFKLTKKKSLKNEQLGQKCAWMFGMGRLVDGRNL